MSHSVWERCLLQLENELPAQQFNTWIRPLKVDPSVEVLRLLAPNRFVLDWVNEKFLRRIRELAVEQGQQQVEVVVMARPSAALGRSYQRVNEAQVDSQDFDRRPPSPYGGGQHQPPPPPPVDIPPRHYDTGAMGRAETDRVHAELGRGGGAGDNQAVPEEGVIVDHQPSYTRQAVGGNGWGQRRVAKEDIEGGLTHRNYLNTNFTFANFVEGKSNQLGLAAASQVSENPGGSYNPLFIYGGVGLGKTHLMHAVGNALINRRPNAKVVYLHSERFVADMVKALQLNAINDFKRYYRSVDALLIDDIQFFAGKERSQEEFFHTFNALLEGGQQIILTCDRYPKEINGLEERLKSRFGWGLTVAIEPPELETRVAILMKKAQQAAMDLPNDAAFFIGQRIRSNVRELEGALKRVIANAHFTGKPISIDLVRESLKDLLALQDRLVSIDNIQRVVAEYYKIKVSDLNSKRRSRSVARPRQVAMYLAKDLTNHSLPEIGEVFGGRDHTTVLHACRKIKELLESSADIREDVKNLLRTLTT